MKETVTVYQTWRFDTDLPHDERSAFAAHASAAGVRPEMLSNARFASTYVLLEVPAGARVSELASRYPSAQKNESAIFALAIEPEAADALPALAAALGGPGAPEGVTRADIRDRALLLEFVPALTPWAVIKPLIDIELKRFGSTTRRTALLSPLSVVMEAQIAADGLQCPELQEGRVLEALVRDVDR